MPDKNSPVWFVGAAYGGNDDQMPRFLSEGIWENGYKDRHLDLVRSMQPGERIAIKAAYTRKHGLPFDNRNQTVSVMAIKAIGVITENLNDGRRVRVNWTKVEPLREWYFYTHRGTVWRVAPGEWMPDELIAFTFEGNAQDIERFCNAPFWRDRFGTAGDDLRRFSWTKFYEAIADKLLDYRNNRAALIQGLKEIAARTETLSYLAQDEYVNGEQGFVRDICPFTVMGMFNRDIKDENRKILAGELAKLLKVEEAVPERFDGIPLLSNMKSWFFPREAKRTNDHIDSLWNVFAAGLAFADSRDDEEMRTAFAHAYDNATGKLGVGWNMTIGLYWARPWSMLSLDYNSRVYIVGKLDLEIGLHGPKRRCNSDDYLSLMERLEPRFQETTYSVHSYPELSLEAWRYKGPKPQSVVLDDEDRDEEKDQVKEYVPLNPYTVTSIAEDGCFLEQPELERIFERLKDKRNIILQGPPGTGKTWLARRLAFALVGEKDETKVRAVQFHSNVSYEDFVRGYRPGNEGKLVLADGMFLEMIEAARKAPTIKFVVVIDEINRGNPAQIFGELLTLIEEGKRTPNDAIELAYREPGGESRRVYVPENLYIIGTMNIADRSLALMDLALRRRFSFVNLTPKLGEAWRNWVVERCGVDPALAKDIERRIEALNAKIEADGRLGRSFKIGHSYVTPTEPLAPEASREWFRQVVEWDIGPLMEEYWYDAPKVAEEAWNELLRDW